MMMRTLGFNKKLIKPANKRLFSFFFLKTRDIPEIKMMKKSETCTFFPFLYVEDKKTDIILTTLLISDMTIAAPFKT